MWVLYNNCSWNLLCFFRCHGDVWYWRWLSNGGAFAKQLIALYTTTLGNGTYWLIGIAAFATMFSTTLTTLDASPRAMAKTAKILQLPKQFHLISFDHCIGTGQALLFPTVEYGNTSTSGNDSVSHNSILWVDELLTVSGNSPKHQPNKIMKVWSIADSSFNCFTIWYLST